MSKCPCTVCGQDVTPEQQYMIDHTIGLDGCVVHTVAHFDCLINASIITEPQGSGEKISSEVAASTSRSKEA